MSKSFKSKVIVLTLLHKGVGVTEVARRYGVSRQWVYVLLDRYTAAGLEVLEPGSRQPLGNSSSLDDHFSSTWTPQCHHHAVHHCKSHDIKFS